MATISRFTASIDVNAGYTLSWPGIGDGAWYPVELPDGTIYVFYVDSNQDPVFKKSTDRGVTWSAITQLKACFCRGMAIWYDEWSGITATKYIHVVYTDVTSADTFYRYIDTANSDTLGTERTVFAGTSTAAGGSLSITRARGGNLICATCIDAGAEYDTVKSTDYFENKTSIGEAFEGASVDKVILMPGWAADNQDVMCFYWDASADEVSVKFYDDSGNSWSETSLGTSMVEPTYINPNFAAAVDSTNSQNVLVAWSGTDAANADLRCWKVTEAAQTEVTNVVLNSTDDQGCCALSIKGAIWTCYYFGASGGTELWPDKVKIYYKISSDQGTTWGSETGASPIYYNLRGNFTSSENPCLYVNPVSYNSQYILAPMTLFDQTSYAVTYTVNCPIPTQPRANFQLGM